MEGQLSLYVESLGSVDAFPIPFEAITDADAPYQLQFTMALPVPTDDIESMSVTIIGADGEFAQTSPVYLVR